MTPADNTHDADRTSPSFPLSMHTKKIRTNSPRSSESAEASHSPKTPASPFLDKLHHRFRKSSNASSSVSSEVNTPAEPVDKEEAAQSARRFLLATIRNDWEWPPVDQRLPEETAEEVKKDELLAAREPMGWQSRLEGQSDIEADSDTSALGRKKRRRKNNDPYRFENPDAIATAVLEKKMKRKRRVDAEIQVNEGLRIWTERRDVWTGAQLTVPHRNSAETMAQSGSSVISRVRTSTSMSSKPPLEATSSPTTEVSRQALANGEASDSSTWPLPVESDPSAPYIPIYAPLFPTSHTLRSRIKPPAYPTIYSKVVIQSLTPNVPIPLTHMIGALVDGWKSEGNWPPEAAVAEAAETLKQRRRGKGEGAFARWRREQDEKRRLRRLSADVNNINGGFLEEGEILHEKKGFRRHITGAVKKVLGMGDEVDDIDGGLARMGVKFLDASLSDEVEANGVSGLMEEAKQVQAENISLNKGLLTSTAVQA